MYRILFRLGDFEVTTFGALVALAALAGLWIFHRELVFSSLPSSGVDAALVGVLGGLAGAKIIWAVEFRDTAPFLSLLFSRGGLSWFGGFLGGVGAGLWSLHRRRIPFVPALAAAAPALAVGHAIGRIGCFMVGDDYGRPTDLPWGVAFPRGSPPTAVPVHPTQLYETAGLAVIAWLLIRWRRAGVADTIVFGRYLFFGRSAAISDRVHPRQRARGRAPDAGAIVLCCHHGDRFVVRAQPERKQQEEGRAMTITRSAAMTVVICAGLTEAGSTAGQTARSAPLTSRQTMLGVTGAVNATPSLTVDGRTIAAVWTASKDGATNVYVATSSDAGATFSEPQRVNDVDGDATANNEQPPRVTMSVSGATRTLTVLWSKRERRAAADTPRCDPHGAFSGRRPHLHSRCLHARLRVVWRAWMGVAHRESGGRVHAVWLDGRDAERKMTEAAAHSGMAHKGQPPQDIYHGSITADGRVVESVIATGVASAARLPSRLIREARCMPHGVIFFPEACVTSRLPSRPTAVAISSLLSE